MSTTLGTRPFLEQKCVPLTYSAKIGVCQHPVTYTIICYDDGDQTLEQTMLKLDALLRAEHKATDITIRSAA